ncbi:MAG: four helix bundle protein [Gammaproteobacteria bacterium]|nr:four helix bundle protein [Gammaproteobacteria bacterium]
MSGIKRFEDLIAWQKARELTRMIYNITSKSRFARDFAFRDQIRRASVSVMSNIAEGFERNGAREFHQFLVIAKGSCAEVRSQLYTALDNSYIDDDEFNRTQELASSTARIIGALRAAVYRRQHTVSH